MTTASWAASRWPLVPLRRFAQKVVRDVPESSEVVTAFRDGFVGPRSMRREDGFTFSDLEQGYQGVEKGDLVFHGLDGFAGAFGVAVAGGRCSPVCHVIAFPEDDPRYVVHALRVAAWSGLLEVQVPSTRQRAVDFRNWATLSALPLPRPPLEIQRSIADLLDDELALHDSAIALRIEQAGLVRERHETLAERLILGSDVTERTVASLASYVNGFPFKPDDFTADGLPVIRIRQLNDPTAELDFYDGEVDHRHLLRDDDLVFSWSGSLSVAAWHRGPAILNQHLFRVLPNQGVDKAWLRHALGIAIRLFEPYMHGSTMKHITAPMMKAVKLPVPDLAGQRQIADELDAHEQTTQELMALAHEHRRLLQVRRVALVEAVVMGRRHVPARDAA